MSPKENLRQQQRETLPNNPGHADKWYRRNTYSRLNQVLPINVMNYTNAIGLITLTTPKAAAITVISAQDAPGLCTI